MKPKEVVCLMALQFAWPVSVKFDHFFFFFYQTTYYTRTNKIKISQMIISSFSKWLPPRFVKKTKPFQYDLLAFFSIKQKKCHPEIGLQFMITGILWRQSEFFYKIEHFVLFTAWNQQTQTLFKLRIIPSSVESFSLSFLKKFLKVCYIFHRCDIQLFAKQMIFYWTRYWSIFFFLLFHFWDDFIFMQKFFETFLSCFHLAFFKYKEAGWLVQSIFLSNIQTISNE